MHQPARRVRRRPPVQRVVEPRHLRELLRAFQRGRDALYARVQRLPHGLLRLLAHRRVDPQRRRELRRRQGGGRDPRRRGFERVPHVVHDGFGLGRLGALLALRRGLRRGRIGGILFALLTLLALRGLRLRGLARQRDERVQDVHQVLVGERAGKRVFLDGGFELPPGVRVRLTHARLHQARVRPHAHRDALRGHLRRSVLHGDLQHGPRAVRRHLANRPERPHARPDVVRGHVQRHFAHVLVELGPLVLIRGLAEGAVRPKTTRHRLGKHHAPVGRCGQFWETTLGSAVLLLPLTDV